MERERNLPVPGEIYRHFKNRIYQIVAVAAHTETGEQMVVYQALYGSFGVWVRPLSMFMEEIDREKYPEATQTFRFEKVEPEEAFCAPAPAEDPSPMPSLLTDFFDAESYDRKLECLAKLSGRVGQRELDSIYLVMDLKPQEGTVTEQLAAVRSQLLMLKKFDGDRLR